MRPEAVTLSLGAWILAGAALADPCKAIPDQGPTPADLARGRTFSGPFVYVCDGDSLCVAIGPRLGADWVEVRVADFYAPELHRPGGQQAKAALETITRGKIAVCRAGKRSYDRVVARCTIDGRSVAAHLRAAGVREGGNGR